MAITAIWTTNETKVPSKWLTRSDHLSENALDYLDRSDPRPWVESSRIGINIPYK